MVTLWKREENRLHEIVLEFVRRKLFSGAVLVHRGQRLLLHRAYGYADVEGLHVNRPDTLYQIGSLTKSFTATAVLQAQEQRLLRLSDPVSQYLPDFAPPNPFAGRQLCIEHLLSNTAGLIDVLHLPIFEQRRQLETPRHLLLDSFRERPLQFEPGSQFAYSNSNWIVLAELIARVSGKTYPEFLDANIFEPLGMSSTGYRTQPPQHNVALGHMLRGGRLAPAETIDVSLMDGAGALHSNIYDLLAFDWGLGAGTLLSPESVALMSTPYLQGQQHSGGQRAYGYGWFIGSVHGRRCVQHEGGLFGFVAGLYRFPEERSAVVLLSNVMDAPLQTLSEALAAELFGVPYQLRLDRSAATWEPGDFARYQGTFEGLFLNRAFQVKLLEREGRYFLDLLGWREFEITPTGPRSFFAFAKGGELEATFCESNGRFDSIQMLWAGTQLVMTRCDR
jgi:CubicO group peptidase (beta-lactamase class C family)